MRRRPPLLRTVALLTAAFAASVVLIACLAPLQRVVVGEGAFIGPSRAVRAPRAGRVADVVCDIGQRVELGDLLVRLDQQFLVPADDELRARYAALELAVAQLERERRHALEDLHPSARQALGRAQNAATLVLDAAHAKERRYGELRTQGLVEQAEFEAAVLARKLSEVELESVRANAAQRPALERAELAAFEARARAIDQDRALLDARRAELELQRSRSVITAPLAGFVLGPTRAELEGRSLAEGEELLRIALPGVEAFVAHVDDRGRARVAPGQDAKLRLNGYPWLVHGTVTARVAQVADTPEAGGYRVRLELIDQGSIGPLFEGMRGRARIATAQRAPIAWLLIEEAFGLGAP